ncbi:hypothetical protein FSP39_022042 [Pinctada imbricata]|uniref:BED-type domain-containing protein n=1 Tax=Pinctada imbricata TaxID=66713 RepID=A0AA88YFA1_PINIB|nr:hypothetical protein FSP39_022042 [Pinctada imbricata]
MADGKLPIIYEFPGRSKSTVWQNFGFYMGDDGQLDKSRAICKVCHHALSYSGNTTNLHAHFRRHEKGPANATGVQSSGSVLKYTTPGTRKWDNLYMNNVSDITYGSSADEHVVSSNQPVIWGNVTLNNRSEALNLMVAEYMIENMLSPDIVESHSFVSLMALADPNFKLQTKEHYTSSIFTQLYDVYRQIMIDLVINARASALTVDVWNSIGGKTYVTFSAHIVTSDWNFDCYNVCTKPCPPDINECYSELMETLHLDPDSLIVVSDSVKVPDPSTGIKIECLGLVIENTASFVLSYRDGPKVVEYVRNHSVEGAARGSDDHWLAIYEKMREITGARTENDHIITQIKAIESVLKPLKLAADHLMEQSDVIASLVLPILRKLELSLRVDDTDSEILQQLKKEAWDIVKNCYQKPEVRDYLLVASLLDPRFKELLFVDVADLKRARNKLVKCASDMYKDMQFGNEDEQFSVLTFENDNTGEPVKKKIKTELIEIKPMSIPTTSGSEGDWLSDVVNKKTIATKEETQETVQAEVERYLAVEQTTSQPLVWWQSRESIYPILSRVARTYLCTPATSLPPEAIFNSSSRDIYSRRKLLPNDLVDKLVFLNSNYAKLKE